MTTLDLNVEDQKQTAEGADGIGEFIEGAIETVAEFSIDALVDAVFDAI